MVATNRDPSPSSTLAEQAEPALPRQPTTNNASQPGYSVAPDAYDNVPTNPPKLADGAVNVDAEVEKGIKDGQLEPKEKIELDEDGRERKVVLVLEETTGKELVKDVSGGPYTIPQW